MSIIWMGGDTLTFEPVSVESELNTFNTAQCTVPFLHRLYRASNKGEVFTSNASQAIRRLKSAWHWVDLYKATTMESLPFTPTTVYDECIQCIQVCYFQIKR